MGEGCGQSGCNYKRIHVFVVLLCCWSHHPRPKGGQETALPSSQSSPTLANCLEEHVFLTKRRRWMLERRMVSWISWTIAFYVSWNPFNDLEVFEKKYPPHPCNTLRQHAKLQHLGIKIQLNLTSADARLQKGLGTKVLAVPDRWLPPSWVSMQVKESILDVLRKWLKKGVQLLIVTLSSTGSFFDVQSFWSWNILKSKAQ